MAKKIARQPYGSTTTLCLEDDENDFGRVNFSGRALKLKSYGYPKSGEIARLVDGSLDGVEIDPEPYASSPLDAFNTSNGTWSHMAHSVQCDGDENLPETAVTIKNFAIWWKYQKGTSPVVTYWLLEIISVAMPPCVYLGVCPTFKQAAKKKPAQKASKKAAKKKSK